MTDFTKKAISPPSARGAQIKLETMRVISAILIVYTWLGVGVLISFLGRIAYFYEKTSGQSTGYYFLVFPTVILMVGAGWYLVHNVDFTGEPMGDVLLLLGGGLLSFFGARLEKIMTGER